MRGLHGLAFLALAACSGGPPPSPPTSEPTGEPSASSVNPAFVQALDGWHATRVERLQAEDGWLALVGLAWFEHDGAHGVGRAEDVTVSLPRGPARVGTFDKEGDTVRFTPADGVAVTADGAPVTGTVVLRHDQDDAGPTVLGVEGMRLHLIERQGRLGIRVKDPQASTRTEFEGIPRFDADPAWVVTARLEPWPEPRTVSVPTVLGSVLEEASPGVLVFELDGQEHRLSPIGDESSLFLVFGDATNGLETYGGGRFLSAAGASDDGTVELDFNKSINPPCAFTAFATCPLPPKENKLGVRIEAGEKVPAGAEGH